MWAVSLAPWGGRYSVMEGGLNVRQQHQTTLCHLLDRRPVPHVCWQSTRGAGTCISPHQRGRCCWQAHLPPCLHCKTYSSLNWESVTYLNCFFWLNKNFSSIASQFKILSIHKQSFWIIGLHTVNVSSLNHRGLRKRSRECFITV